MSHFELPSERLAREKLEATRSRERERQQRIFDHKLRTIGVDTEALDLQVEEKKKLEEEAKKEQEEYDAAVRHNTKTACLLHKALDRERRATEQATVEFREQYQQPWQGRDFDLIDPDARKKIRPEDAQMILPGLLGEDPGCQRRQRMQKLQLRDWLIQQQTEQEAERRQQELEEQRYNQSVIQMDNDAMQLQHLEMERRKEVALDTQDFNLAKMEEKKRQEREDDLGGYPTGLDAAACVGVPGLGPSSEMKAPPESLQEVAEFQLRQIEERKRAESDQRREEEHLYRIRSLSARSALLLERQQARLDRQLRREQDSTNARLAQTHREQNPDIERGSIDPSFFTQFNTCSR